MNWETSPTKRTPITFFFTATSEDTANTSYVTGQAMENEISQLRVQVAKLAAQFDAFSSAKEQASQSHGALLKDILKGVESNQREQRDFVKKHIESVAALEMPEEQYKTLIETANGRCCVGR